LAVDAGVDFPWLTYQLATGTRTDSIDGYRIGVRNRWLLGDLDHLYLSWKESTGWSTKYRAIAGFVKGFGSGTRHEVNRCDDLRPFVVELKRYLTRER
jgi:hypothetical protein